MRFDQLGHAVWIVEVGQAAAAFGPVDHVPIRFAGDGRPDLPARARGAGQHCQAWQIQRCVDLEDIGREEPATDEVVGCLGCIRLVAGRVGIVKEPAIEPPPLDLLQKEVQARARDERIEDWHAEPGALELQHRVRARRGGPRVGLTGWSDQGQAME